MGIEPTLAAWEAAVLPLNYTRIARLIYVLLNGAATNAIRSANARRFTVLCETESAFADPCIVLMRQVSIQLHCAYIAL